MDDTIGSLVSKVNNKLEGSAYFYLSNDPERALGLETLLKNYHVVHIDRSQYLDDFAAAGIKYFCLQEELPAEIPPGQELFRSSLKLIKSPKFLSYFASNKQQINYFQTFKISPAFAISVNGLGGVLLNTPAILNRLFEDKISQYQELTNLPVSLPKTIIAKLSDLSYHNAELPILCFMK